MLLIKLNDQIHSKTKRRLDLVRDLKYCELSEDRTHTISFIS